MSAATSSVNKKLPDGTLISIGGTSAEDLLNNIAVLVGDEGLLKVQAEIVAAFTAQPSPSNPPAQNGAPAPAPAPVQAHPSNAPTCQHGTRTWKEGTSANGRAWKAWMCPAPKGQSCAPEWVR